MPLPLDNLRNFCWAKRERRSRGLQWLLLSRSSSSWSVVRVKKVMRVEDSHQDDGLAAAEDAVDDRLEEVGNVAESGFPDDEASRQEARIADGNVFPAALDLDEMIRERMYHV